MTEKQTIKIHGKDYELVASRVHRFRTDHPDKSIITNIYTFGAGEIIIKAEIKDKDTILATGHAHEKADAGFINKTSYVEVAETSAIGRALACFDYQGGEYASADEITVALANQNKPQNKSTSLPHEMVKATGDIQWISKKFDEIAKKTPLAKELYRDCKLGFVSESLGLQNTLLSSKVLTQPQIQEIANIITKTPKAVENYISQWMDRGQK